MLALAGLVSFSFVGTSCGDDDDDDPKPVTVEKVKVTFDTDGGSAVAAVEVEKGKEVSVAAPTKEGFTFKGWATEKGGTVQSSIKPDKDITLYAVWEKNAATETVKVKFDTDGGSEVAEIEIAKGGTVNVAAPTKENFTFKGWATTKGGEVVADIKADADITLYAVWEAAAVVEKVKITFDTDGGSEVAAIEVEKGAAISVAAPTKEGFTFKGWATEKGGAVVADLKADAEATLYAVWEANSENPPSDVDRCIKVSSADLKSFNYDTQFWIVTEGFSKDATFELTMSVKADYEAVSKGPQIHNAPGAYVGGLCNDVVTFRTEWEDVKIEGTFSADGKSIAFNLNDDDRANNYYFDNIVLKINGEDVIKNGNCSGDEVVSFAKKEDQGETGFSTASFIDRASIKEAEPRKPKQEDVNADGVVVDVDQSSFTAVAWDGTGDPSKISFEDGVIVVKNPEATANFWDVQYNVVAGVSTHADVEYTVTITMKGSAAGKAHYKVGDWSDGKMGEIEFTSEWSDVVISGTDFKNISGGFLMLQHGDFVGDLYIKAVKIVHKPLAGK